MAPVELLVVSPSVSELEVGVAVEPGCVVAGGGGGEVEVGGEEMVVVSGVTQRGGGAVVEWGMGSS